MNAERMKKFMVAVLEIALEARTTTSSKEVEMLFTLGRFVLDDTGEPSCRLAPPLPVLRMAAGDRAQAAKLIAMMSEALPSDFALMVSEAWVAQLPPGVLPADYDMPPGGVKDVPGAHEIVVVDVRTNTGRRYCVSQRLGAGAGAEARTYTGFGESAQRPEDHRNVFLDAARLRPCVVN